LEVSIVDESSEEPDERLVVLIVTLGRDIVVLEVLLSVESNLLSFDFTVLNVNLVSDKHNRDALTDSGEILVPLGHVGVGDTGAHIEHDDTTVAANAKHRINS
jgi:hypothetical protein